MIHHIHCGYLLAWPSKYLLQKKDGYYTRQKDVSDKFNELYTTYTVKKKEYDLLPPELKSITTDPPKPEVLTAAEEFNNKIDKVNAELSKQTQRGNKPLIPAFKKIDLSDGISPAELIYMDAGTRVGEFIKYTEKRTSTNNDIEYARIASAEKMNADDNANARYLAKLKIAPPPTVDTNDAGYDGNIIYGVNTTFTGGNKVINGVVYDSGNNKSNFTGYIDIPTKDINSNVQTEYNKFNKDAQGVQVNEIQVKDNGTIRYKFENGEAVGVLAKNKSYVSVDDFAKVTAVSGQKGETKYISETQVGSKKGGNPKTNNIPTVSSKSDFDKLKSGDIFIENGVKYKKP